MLLRRSDSKWRKRRRLALQCLEQRTLFAVSAEEQFFVYRLNQARQDPGAYSAEEKLPVDLSNVTPRQPLAIVDALFNSSSAKSLDMIEQKYFGHVSPTGVYAHKLVRNHGYALPLYVNAGGSNYYFGDNGNAIESLTAGYGKAKDAVSALINDGGGATGGHRDHLLGIPAPYSVYNEIGVGNEYRAGSDYGNYWTVHIATRNPATRYLTGVAYNDLDNDGYYDVGEGLSGVTIDIPETGATTTTNPAGGWAIAVPDGEYEVRAAGASFAGTSLVPVKVEGQSVEVDFRSGKVWGQVGFSDWVNSAPTLIATLPPTLSPAFITAGTEPVAIQVRTLISDRSSDVDPVPKQGIAISGVANSGGGKWQYSTDGTWQDFPAISDQSALLLRDSDRVRYSAPTKLGNATLTYHAWDQTSGAAGTTEDLSNAIHSHGAYSAELATATLPIVNSNHSPQLTATNNRSLPSFPEDTATPQGTKTKDILGLTASDTDSATSLGVGISGYQGSGAWQYSLDAGTTWTPLDLKANEVLPLRSDDQVRFVPDRDFHGNVSIEYHAWDQQFGTAGVIQPLNAAVPTGHQSSFSQSHDTAKLVVTPLNDAPVIANNQTSWLNPIPTNKTFSGDGTKVADILGQLDSDVDSVLPDQPALRGIAITAKSGNGTWWFQNNGNWNSGTVSDGFAWLLKSTDRVQFVPIKDFTGTATISYRAWDQTTGPETSDVWADVSQSSKYGGTKAYSVQKQSATIFVGVPGNSPAINSITRLDTNPINADFVRLQVEFSEPVTNVTAGDFELLTTDTASGVISEVTGSGSRYEVRITTLAGKGKLGIALNNDRDIRDSVGNLLLTTAAPTNEQYNLSRDRMTLDLSAVETKENVGADSINATIRLEVPAAAATTIHFISSDPATITLPESITIPQGETTSTVNLNVVDDRLLDGRQTVTIQATAENFYAVRQDLAVDDYELLTLALNTLEVNELDGTAKLTVTRGNSDDIDADLAVMLQSSDPAAATVPSPIVIPAGKVSVDVIVHIVDDLVLDGPQTTIFSLAASGYENLIDDLAGPPGTNASLSVLDNELPEPVDDFGDAPTPYAVSLAADGARHRVSELRLGNSIDAELNGFNSNQIDQDGDDGIRFQTSIVGAATSAIASLLANSSIPGKLDAWIDFNRDGDWDDDDEQIYTSQPLAAGDNWLSFTVPTTINAGTTAARFRVSTSGGLEPLGAASDGEVEDYIIELKRATTPQDVQIQLPETPVIATVIDNNIVFATATTTIFKIPMVAMESIELLGTTSDDELLLESIDDLSGLALRFAAGAGNDKVIVTGQGGQVDLTAADLAFADLEMIDIAGDGDNQLVLSPAAVLAMTAADHLLSLVAAGGDHVQLGTGWTVAQPHFDGIASAHHLTASVNGETIQLQLTNSRKFQNPLNRFDADCDGKTTVLDALKTLNAIVRQARNSNLQSVLETAEIYFDPTGDNQLSLIDTLQIINEIARLKRLGSSSGEAPEIANNDSSLMLMPATLMASQPEKRDRVSDTYLSPDRRLLYSLRKGGL